MVALQDVDWRGLAEEFDLDLVVQFGSSLKPNVKARDLDLGLVGPTRPELETLVSRFCHTLRSCDLDLSWLPTAGWLLPWEAVRDGCPRYERTEGTFAEYRNLCAREWMEGRLVWGRRLKDYLHRAVNNCLSMKRELILRKAAQINQNIGQLQGTLPETAGEFEENYVLHHAAERLLELLVEDAATINTEVGVSVAGIPPSDYYSSFFAMASAKWLTQELALNLAEMATLRNTLVHRYERIDLKKLHGKLKASLPLWRAYLAELDKRL